MTYPHDPAQYGPPPAHPGQPQHGPPPGQHGPVPPGGVPPYGGPPPGQYGPGGPPRKRNGVLISVIIGASLLVVVLIVGVGAVLVTVNSEGASGVPDEQTYEIGSTAHVETGEVVDYPMHPPAGGEHYDLWQDCGVYEDPVRNELAVHSLEHGAVWITYDPGMSREGHEELADLYSTGDYLLVSPMENLPAPVVASAWGAQVEVADVGDRQLANFLDEYEQSEHVPEPGGPCSGGFAGTESDFEEEFGDG